MCTVRTHTHVLPTQSLSLTEFRESDRDLVSSAAAIFIVSSVKVPIHTTALITSEMNHQLPDQRINALYRFQVRKSDCEIKTDDRDFSESP